MSACFGKIFIALQLLRIINKQNKLQAYILWFMTTSLFLVNVVCLIITFAQCTPVYALWDRTVGTCWSPFIQLDSGYVQGAYSAFTDLFLTLFPIVIIWNLQIKLNVKVALAAAPVAAATIKTAHLGELSNPDFTWVTVDLIIWYTTENYIIIIISACLPTLRPLFNLSLGSAAASKEPKKRLRGYPSGSGGSASKSAASHPYRVYDESQSDEAYVLSRMADNPYQGDNKQRMNYEVKPALYSPADEVNGVKKTTEISIV
ncbi:hypothetical protein MMC18_008454 [Xylographa bjoerkii]|nr:hypothetical protein [Xylographa bjoerkii]